MCLWIYVCVVTFFFNVTATTEIYTYRHTLSLHDALPICHVGAHVRLYHHLIKGDGDGTRAHNDFYDEYLAVMDLPAEYYLQTVKSVFQDHDLPLGRMTCRGDLEIGRAHV